MSQKPYFFSIVAVLIASVFWLSDVSKPTDRFTVTIVDSDSGKPIVGASVLEYQSRWYCESWYEPLGKTNSKGKLLISKKETGSVIIQKTGFNTRFNAGFRGDEKIDMKKVDKGLM